MVERKGKVLTRSIVRYFPRNERRRRRSVGVIEWMPGSVEFGIDGDVLDVAVAIDEWCSRKEEGDDRIEEACWMHYEGG